jgi:hypothetical protein
VTLFNGGFAPPGYHQGTDAMVLPPRPPQVWKRGAAEEVAFGITVNHGGGYSYRLCKLDAAGKVSEECFQKNPLKFAGDKQWLQYGQFVPNQPRFEVNMWKTNTGTYPAGSDWARIPVPACKFCTNLIDQCGEEMSPNMTDPSGTLPTGETYYGGQTWINQIECAALCTGATPIPVPPPPPINVNGTEYGLSDGMLCSPGMTEFEEVMPGVSGFLANHSYPDRSVVGYSIVDTVIVPDLEDGSYLLSWRWDCEATYQVWENCADIEIKGSVSAVPPTSPMDEWRLYFIIAVSALFVVTAAAIINACCSRCRKTNTPLLRERLRSSVNQ